MIKLFKEIKGVFVQPKRKYYLGKIAYGTPYFNPLGFVPTIIKCRKLKLKSPEQLAEYKERYSHAGTKNNNYMFTNMPIVHRAKEWTFEFFGSWYWLQIGCPVYIYWHDLGWKWKYDSVRFEWCPAFYIFFFNLQFCIWWTAPDSDNDKYYEMILWYLKSAGKDIIKAEKTWGWVDYKTKVSTWNKNYIL